MSLNVSASVDCSLIKTASQNLGNVGSNLTYTLTITNAGPSPATGVTVIDALPFGVTFVSSTGTCTGSSTVNCNIGSLASGATATVTITITPQATGTITNTATVSANEPDPDTTNNTSTVTTPIGPSCNFVISAINQTFSAAGGTGTVNVTAAAGCAWNAASNSPWVTITPPGSGSGNGSIAYNVLANAGSFRTASITVAGKTLSIEQGAPAAQIQFAFPLNYDAGTTVYSVIPGDFNGDGITDAVVGTQAGISVFVGTGPGVFRAPVAYNFGVRVLNVFAVDVNADGKPDLVLWSPDAGFGVAIGNGDRTFQSPVYYDGGRPSAIADFTRTGRMDVVLGGVSVWRNLGNGQYTRVFQHSTGDGNAVAADVNGDGYPDLIVAEISQAEVYLNDKNGGFLAPVRIVDTAYSIASADLNGDGLADLVLGGTSSISVYLSKGDGTFSTPVRFPTPVQLYVGNIQVADVDGDGRPDITVGDGSAVVFRNIGNGYFEPGIQISGTNGSSSQQLPGVQLFDMDGDHRPDLVVASTASAPTAFSIFRNITTSACNFGLSQSSFSIPAAGGAITVNVSAASGCMWTATASQSWISIMSGSTGTG